MPKERAAARAFFTAITTSKTANKFDAAVYMYSEQDYTQMDLHVIVEGTAGFKKEVDMELVSFNTSGRPSFFDKAHARLAHEKILR